ncbi:MAG: DEAD/DEAH box helicase family protein [Gammaproteobacteria bacterium]|nr:DEAD/DEAH box helicase family protein [Gammaproteobacteria bacterium]
MILKEFQKRALEQVRGFVEQLAEQREKAQEIHKQFPETEIDWAEQAWKKSSTRPYVPRRNGLDEPLPAFCLKIPTGGGKTLLATKVIDLVNTHYLRRQTGLVLWIVPTTQIYNQTLKALKDRDHPYRQQLDLASAGRTLVLEKISRFGPRDIRECLCVLMLMLPSANRATKDQLRMFRDSGGFGRFFPGEGDISGHRQLIERIPNLDAFEQQGGMWGRHAKTSLGNTLRLLQPLIVLDEGHKAYSRNAKKTLEGFNPCMIVELSATPPRGANVLVDIKGVELNAEEMIKLDLNIRNLASASWQDTLLAAIEHRKLLEEQARLHEANTGAYIRPICVIQVERTGRQQRKPGVIHAEDAREYLLRHPDIRPEQIAVKTSQRDELKEVDELGGLMARECAIRFIITKQALQEGWDCSFAYVLAILTNPGSRTALTQLVGRILRQPNAHKTGDSWLDESYVFCFQRRGAELLDEVRKGFGLEGLQGLEGRITAETDGTMQPQQSVVLKQREKFKKAARDLVLPAFMIQDGSEWRLVHYEADILSRVPWDEVDVTPLAELNLSESGRGDVELRAGLDSDPLMERHANGQSTMPDGEEPAIDYLFAASHLLEVMPNPWRGREVAKRAFEALLERHSPKQVLDNYTFILESLRRHLESERDRLSHQVFSDLLESGTMRFLVVTKDMDFNQLPEKIDTAPGRQANREDGGQYVLNLFERTHEDELNGLENKVATYLDRQERLFFWYRNRARKDYYVQGWKRGRIYADFIFTLKADETGVKDECHQVYVVETKGIHLKQSADTDYKRSVFDICSQHAAKKDWAEFVPAMRDRVMRFEIVDEDEWQNRLNAMLAT